MTRFLAGLILALLRFRDRGREIYRYHDGRRWRRADPLAVYRALKAHPEFDWDADPAVAELEWKIPEEKDFTSWRKSVDAARDVFGVPRFEDGGLTESELSGLLVDFTAYLGVQKKSGNPPPTSPPATASPPSAEGSPTSAGSACI